MAKFRKWLKHFSQPNNDVNTYVLNFLERSTLTASVIRLILNVLYRKKASGCIHNEIESINNTHIRILSSKHVLFIAKLLQEKLTQLGISSEIFTENPKEGFADGLYFVLCPHVFNPLPRKYIAFQFEQLPVINRWWSKISYQKIFYNAIAVVDYSLLNIKFLVENNFPSEKLFYLPIFSKVNESLTSEHTHDVLFYGHVNERRRKILKELKKDFNITIADNCFGQQMHEILKKSKVILNIHSQDNGMVESARLFECLSMGKNIVSETGLDQGEYRYLEQNIVSFVPSGNTTLLKEALHQVLSNSDIKDKEQQISQKLGSCFDPFSFNLSRAFLALGLITLDNFIQFNTTNFLSITSNVFISQNTFSSDEKSNTYFPILKHFIPWLSKEITIKYLTYLAKVQALPYIEIRLNSNKSAGETIHKNELWRKSKKLLKKKDSLYIPAECYDNIISWNEYRRMRNKNNYSIFELFEEID